MKRLLPLFLVLAVAAPAASRYQPSDQLRLVTVADPQLAPDGKTIVCVVSRANLKDNRNNSQLVRIDVASGAQHTLTTAERRGVTAPRFSPSGAALAFLSFPSATETKRQIFVLPMTGGEARKITSAPQGVQQFAWSPDGQSIAYVTADEPPKLSDEEKHNLSFEIANDSYLITKGAVASHVWLVGANGTGARRLTSGGWTLPMAMPPGPPPSPLSWSADGKTLAITRLESPHTGDRAEGWVELLDIASGQSRRLTAHTHSESQAAFSPDGQRISYLYPRSGDRSDFQDVWVTSAQGGAEGRNVTRDLDCNIGRGVWTTDGRALVVGGHHEGGVALWLQPADGGAARRFDLGEVNPFTGYWLDVTVARDGGMAFTGLTATQPRELYYMASAESKPRRLTHFNDAIAALDLGRSERVTWEIEGFKEDGIVTYPPGFDAAKKYPLVLYVHGGPRSASLLSFSSIPQALAAQGWIVFQPNYRGSDNLGQAYARAVVKDAGPGPGRDVMAGLALLKKRSYVDPSRIAVGGWSYGGYMTTWLIGNYPDVFRAAVAGAAVTNLLDQYNLSDSNVGRRSTLGGSPYADPEVMKRTIEHSPITYAPKVKTPTLILSDTGDYRVTITQSFAFYHALRDNGVPVRFFAYPVSGHSPEDPVHSADITRRYVDWFKLYLTEGTAPAAQ